MPDSYPDFPSAKQIVGYFNDYVDHFKLREHIQFETKIVSCEPIDHGNQWKITFLNQKDNSTYSKIYKGIIVANGHHWDMVWEMQNNLPADQGKPIQTKPNLS